ncbi:Uncharacterised protein g5912 [Pycnogonum litorale]
MLILILVDNYFTHHVQVFQLQTDQHPDKIRILTDPMFSSSCDVELEELMKNIDLAVQDKCESLQKEVRIAMENLRAKDLQITRLKKELESGQKLVKILNEKIHKMESDRRLETIRNKILTEVKSRDVEEEENVNIYKLKQELALAKGETSIKDAKIRISNIRQCLLKKEHFGFHTREYS